MRSLSMFCLLAAVGLGYLLYVDRLSPMAVTALEWNLRLGAPLVPVLGLSGLVGLLYSYREEIGRLLRGSDPAPRRPPAPRSAPTGRAPTLIEASQLEPGSHLEHDREGFPLMLVLTNMPPERARRAVDLFFSSLSHQPLPSKLRVRFVGCPPSGLPRHHLVQGIARRHLPDARLHCALAGEDVDVLFQS